MDKLQLLGLFIIILVFAACDKDNYASQRYENPSTQAEIDQNSILDYLEKNDIKAKRTKSGLYYVIEDEGTGERANKDDYAKMNFIGSFLDGKEFASSAKSGGPALIPLDGGIEGVSEGVQLIKKGGKCKLYIPSGLAAGIGGAQKKPIIFDIELVDIIDTKIQAKKDDEILQKYFTDNNIKAEKTPEGIYYVIEEAGSDEKPTVDSYVAVHYNGTRLDGTKFDSSYDRGESAMFSLGQVVKGWQIGIPLFGKGGKGKIYIPSGLAYGPRGAGNDIPPNTIITFDIELEDIMDEAGYKAAVQKRAEEKIMAQAAEDDKVLQEYFKKNNIKAKKTPEGVYYVIEKAGGAKPNINSEVTVHYEGTLLDGTKFDSSYDRGEQISFPLAGVVKGWQIGIPLIGKGGKGKLYIPSGLAYGPRGSGGKIPPNSCLIFKVELFDFKEAQPKAPPVK